MVFHHTDTHIHLIFSFALLIHNKPFLRFRTVKTFFFDITFFFSHSHSCSRVNGRKRNGTPQWDLESWSQNIWDDVNRRHRGVDVKLSDRVVYNMKHHAMESTPINVSAYGKCEKRRKMRKSWSCVSDSSVMYLRSLSGGIEWSRRRWDGTAIGVHAGFRERIGTTAIGKCQ